MMKKRQLIDELREKSIKLQLVQVKNADRKHFFIEFSKKYKRARMGIFPFTYIKLRDLMVESTKRTTDMRLKWHNTKLDLQNSGAVTLDECLPLDEKELKRKSKVELYNDLQSLQRTLIDSHELSRHLEEFVARLENLPQELSGRRIIERHRILKRTFRGITRDFNDFENVIV